MTAERPRIELAKLLRETLRCPMRHGAMETMLGMDSPDREPVRIIAFRPNSFRLECRECGLRFSVDPTNLADTLARLKTPPTEVIQGEAMRMTHGDPKEYAGALAAITESVRRNAEAERRKVLEPHKKATAQAKPRKGQIRFPKRMSTNS